MKKEVLTADAPAPIGPYSQAIAHGPFLFCSGQIPLDPKTNELNMGSIQDQTRQVMENIKAVLAANNCSFSNVVKTTIYLADMNDFANVNEIYGQYFQKPYPARSTVAVKTLPKNTQVEIEVLAYKA